MDPADTGTSSAEPGDLLQALNLQGIRVGQNTHDLQQMITTVRELFSCMQNLGTKVDGLVQTLQPPASPAFLPPTAAAAQQATMTPEPHIPPPAKYAGNPSTCRQFLTQCQLTFNAQPSRYRSEAAKMAYLVNLLEGPPLSLFSAYFEQNNPLVMSFSSFSEELKRAYDHPVRGQQAGQHLMKLRQGKHSIREFVTEFRSLAVESGWNDHALATAFQSGLNRETGREVALRGETLSLDQTIKLAINIADHISLWETDRSPSAPSSTSRLAPPLLHESRRAAPSSPEPEPMQLGRARLSPAERDRRMRSGDCLYCGQKGHFIVSCPQRPKEGAHQ